jgi:hypothetical protein
MIHYCPLCNMPLINKHEAHTLQGWECVTLL